MARFRFPPDWQARFEALPPGEQLRARKLLEEFEARTTWNPLEGYVPASPKHESLHLAREPLRAIFGGNRSGKTTTAIVDDLIQMTPAELLPEHLRPYKMHECPFFCRVMTPDMERTMKPVIHQKLREWTPKALLRDGAFDRAYDRTAQALRLECGCRFDFLSYEMSLDKFGGAALHRCHYDEEPPEDIRNECVVRLIDFNGDELLSMTPLQGMTWAYRRIWQNRAEPGVFTVQVAMEENPHLSTKAIARTLAGMSEDEQQMRRFGRFHNSGGMVYASFLSPSVFVPEVDLLALREADIVIGIDPGIRRAGFVAIAFDKDNRGVVFDTLELRDATAVDYARELRRLNRKWGITKEPLYIIDPAARQRSLTNAESVASELHREGIYAVNGQNDVDAGVLTVRRRLQQHGLFISERLVEFRQEVEDYPLEEHADGTFHPAKTGREHRCDAFRYAVMSRPWDPPVRAGVQDVYADDVARGPVKRAPHMSILGPMA